jgi:hypothetical protein
MSPHATSETAFERLVRFNQQVLAQGLALVAAHEAPGAPAYPRPVGAHLRHVIEHYDALLSPATAGVVDYDLRARDAELERLPAVARGRIAGLQARLDCLAQVSGADAESPLRVRGIGGVAGDFGFEVGSTLGRELVFVASHAVHHFALLQQHCQQHGIAVGAEFGTAPATVAHARAASPSHSLQQETPCTPPTVAA